MPGAPRSDSVHARFLSWPPRPERDVARCLGCGVRGTVCSSAGQKPGRGTGLGCAGRACTRARAIVCVARRIHPVARGVLDAAGAVSRGALRSHPASLPHGDGELRDMVCLGAPARRGRPHVQLGWLATKPRARCGVCWPQPCLRHARPRHACSAQPPGSQSCSSSRRGGAPRSLKKNPRLDGRHSQRHIARRWRAREHEWPRNSILLRGGSSAARRPAQMQVNIPGGASRRHRSITRKHPRGRGEGEDGPGVLTSGRQCSRGRLGVVVHIGVVDVPGGGVPSTSVPWSCTTPAPTARRLLSGGPDSTPRAALSLPGAARRRRAPLLPLLLPLSSPHGYGTEDWGKPQVVGGEPAGVWPWGVDTGQGGPREK
jgi:hypothetical protein